MILKILPFIPLALLAGCEKKAESFEVLVWSRDDAETTKPMIRSIRLSGDENYGGIELNGDRAYRRHGSSGTDKTEISYDEGLKLVEEFYSIPGMGKLRATKDQPKNNSTHHIVIIHDEKPEYYSRDSVVYLIPKDTTDPQTLGWLGKMKRR